MNTKEWNYTITEKTAHMLALVIATFAYRFAYGHISIGEAAVITLTGVLCLLTAETGNEHVRFAVRLAGIVMGQVAIMLVTVPYVVYAVLAGHGVATTLDIQLFQSISLLIGGSALMYLADGGDQRIRDFFANTSEPKAPEPEKASA